MTSGTSADGVAPLDEDALWATVVGQEAAVALLRTAAWSPVHAYLLVGPPGAGRGEAARAFAGSLFASGAPDGPDSLSASRHRRLSAVGRHLFTCKQNNLLVSKIVYVYNHIYVLTSKILCLQAKM